MTLSTHAATEPLSSIGNLPPAPPHPTVGIKEEGAGGRGGKAAEAAGCLDFSGGKSGRPEKRQMEGDWGGRGRGREGRGKESRRGTVGPGAGDKNPGWRSDVTVMRLALLLVELLGMGTSLVAAAFVALGIWFGIRT